jgi:hypothetical protein
LSLELGQGFQAHPDFSAITLLYKRTAGLCHQLVPLLSYSQWAKIGQPHVPKGADLGAPHLDLRPPFLWLPWVGLSLESDILS